MAKNALNILRFDGGVNNDSDPRDIGDNQLSVGQQVVVDNLGKIAVIGDLREDSGLTFPNSITEEGTGFFAFSTDYMGFADGTFEPSSAGQTYYAAENGAAIQLLGATDGENGTITCTNLVSAEMFYVDGALRIVDRDHASTFVPLWRGYIPQTVIFPHCNVHGSNGAKTTISQGFYTENLQVNGAFPEYEVTIASQTFTVADNALMLNTAYALDAERSWPSGEVAYSFDSHTDVTTADGDNDGTHTEGNGNMEWGLALEFTEDINGTGGWMPRASSRYKFYVTTMYDEHTQESLPQLFRMVDSEDSNLNASFDGKSISPEIAFRDGDSDTEGEYVSISFRPVIKAHGGSGGVYNFGAANVDDEDSGNTRISGLRVYWATNEDGYTTLWQLFDCKFDTGVRCLGAGDAGSGTFGFAPFTDAGSTHGGNYHATIGSVASDMVWDDPPRFLQYDVLNAHSSTDSISVDTFQTSVVANRCVYIGNIGRDGSKYGDRMLRSGVNQFDKFPSIQEHILSVSVNDGDEIIKLVEYADRILQFKKNSLYIVNVSGNSEYLESSHKYKGISNPGAACRTDYGVAWVNKDGCYMYDGESVSDLLEDEGIRKIVAGTLVRDTDQDGWAGFIGTTLQERIGFNIGKRQLLITSNQLSRIYDLITKSWVFGKDNCYNLNSNMINDPDGGGLMQCGSTNKIYKWRDSAASTRTNFIIKTKELDFGNPSQRKKIYKIHITHKNAGDGDQLGLYGEIFALKGTSQGPGEMSDDFFLGYLQEDSGHAGSNVTQTFEMPTVDLAGAPIKFSNVYTLRLYVLSEHTAGVWWTGPGSEFTGAAHQDFLINDINVVFRQKPVR